MEMPNGAGRFLAFLTDELKPWLQERYSITLMTRCSSGTRVADFSQHTSSSRSPQRSGATDRNSSLYRDDSVKSMFDHEAEYAQTQDDLPAKVSFTVGGYENPDGYRRRLEQLAPDHRARMEADPGDWAEDYVGDTERMVTTLRGRAYPSLEIDHQVLPANTTRRQSP